MLPVWLWGVVASSLFVVPSSLYALHDINKNNNNFKDYLANRGSLKNVLLFVKSIAKVLIPFINILYTFSIASKVCKYGLRGLTDFWEKRIITNDNKLNKAREKLSKVFNGSDNNKDNKVQDKTDAFKKDVVAQKSPINNVQTNSKVTDKKVITLDASICSYSELECKLDSYNNSSVSTEVLNKFYSQEYWNLRKAYNNETDKKKQTDIYNKLCILYKKKNELKQIRSNNKTLVRK